MKEQNLDKLAVNGREPDLAVNLVRPDDPTASRPNDQDIAAKDELDHQYPDAEVDFEGLLEDLLWNDALWNDEPGTTGRH